MLWMIFWAGVAGAVLALLTAWGYDDDVSGGGRDRDEYDGGGDDGD